MAGPLKFYIPMTCWPMTKTIENKIILPQTFIVHCFTCVGLTSFIHHVTFLQEKFYSGNFGTPSWSLQLTQK